jgi:cell division protein FtsW
LQKFFFLPEAHNDFIAAIIAEELGAVGIWLTIVVFAVVVARGVTIALRSEDDFGTYVAFGISTLIGVQVLANLGVAMGLLPTKGLNLPFVSYGGSALVVSLFAVGILLNISKGHRVKEPTRTSKASKGNSKNLVKQAVEEA